MYTNLKLQIWRCGIRQNRLAQLLGIHETVLSKIINGYREPDGAMKARIANLLKADDQWLFTSEPPSSDGVAHIPLQQEIGRE